MKLRDFDNGSDAASVVAAGSPATWEDAIAGYLARRRRLLLQGIAGKSSFDADGIRHRLKVLTEVGQTLGAAIQKIDPDAEVTIERTPQMSREEHQLALAYLLTPLGWREKRRPAIAKRRELALAEWEESTDPERNLALVAELDELSLFLEAVERDAHLVTATRTREQFVGNIPLGGFDRGS